MSAQFRLALLVLSLLVLCFALVAIGYTLWPLETAHLQATLPATFLAPP